MIGQTGTHQYCGLGDPQSFVDPVSNVAVLGPVTLRAHAAGLLEGRASPKLLGTFLHELTHHWCFLSPVGNAIAGLRMRAEHKLAQAGLDCDSESLESALRDLTISDTVVSLLRPYAEGLALFAEFDATPGKSPCISIPLKWAHHHFAYENPERPEEADRTAVGLGGLGESLFRIHRYGPPALEYGGSEASAMQAAVLESLAHARLDQRSVDKKAGLLVKPLLEDGGYLAGYLTVKNLYFLALEHCEMFSRDSDAFLSYLRSWIYSDYGLVDALLAPHGDGISAGSRILLYFTQRLRKFVSSVRELSGEFNKYDRARAVEVAEAPRFYPQQEFEQFPGLLVDEAASMRGCALLHSLMEGLQFSTHEDDAVWELCETDVARMSQRELAFVGELPGQAHAVGAGVLFTCDGVPIAVGRATEQNREEHHARKAVLQYFLSVVHEYQAFAIVGAGGETIGLIHPSGISESERKRIDNFLLDRNQLLREKAKRDALVAAARESPTRAGQQLRFFEEHLLKELAEFYFLYATLRLPEEALERVCKPLLDSGLWQLLDRDKELVEALAALGLASSAGLIDKPQLANYLGLIGWDLRELATALSPASVIFGTPLVLEPSHDDVMGTWI
ncbi:hypothetical protein SGFS_042810 [Streptomyces graminofaciens]|uniref:Uncharacterized protein n=1 Tax=Streptomyces graminofaciens TaxID=68212 RepID=A0ABN5VLJ0_9ACTN|nr:hypothetical protein [Streptomyces graminofaciens]BBC32987.1 hypothetical protein SGFS_042810 [Streptomyces graminofaciens]